MAMIFVVAALVSAGLYGVMVGAGLDRFGPGAVIKTASVAGLALAGLALGAPSWIVAGLALGAVGDFALTRSGTRGFLAGMVAFGLGHLAYAVGFWQIGQGATPSGWVDWGLTGAIVLLVAATEVWLAPFTGALRWPVRLYCIVIGIMSATVVLLPPGAGRGVLQIGAVLFVLSDTLLAIRLFRATQPGSVWVLLVALWPAYWAGQALILAGSMIYWADF